MRSYPPVAASSSARATCSQSCGPRCNMSPVRRLCGNDQRSVALLVESPEAHSVTSWPRATSPWTSWCTTASVPPYPGGGTVSQIGASCRILNAPNSRGASGCDGWTERGLQRTELRVTAPPEVDAVPGVELVD